MLEAKALRMQYGARTVLDVPQLSVDDGACTVLVGANGSGKTTLLRILAGQLKPTAGTFSVPQPVLYLPQRTYAFRGTVLQNILIGMKNKKEDALALLDRMELTPLLQKQARSLSGGELQRLAFCRLMLRESKLLLLDEPTSACDTHAATLLLQELQRYRVAHCCTVLLSTHSRTVAAQIADRCLLLENGSVQADGTPQQIWKSTALIEDT